MHPFPSSYLFKLQIGKIGTKFVSNEVNYFQNTTFYNAYLVPPEPEHACTPVVNARNLSNSIAFIMRGGCSFITKAFHAQLAGALSVIIYDYGRESDLRLTMIQDETDRKLTLPCAFMTGKDGLRE
ncbi:unnamed protein product [Protopolystoma xenopodis]|uniref:PA domain-containing protein n=1 Tax=Protopolystoma xenopodis TaxID=117903 RepID=A0A448XC26_9PLAT|nr:unnamed protein product [Protopolystoma xenopodis]